MRTLGLDTTQPVGIDSVRFKGEGGGVSLITDFACIQFGTHVSL